MATKKPAVIVDNANRVVKIDYSRPLNAKEKAMKDDALAAGYSIKEIRHRNSKNNAGRIQNKAYYKEQLTPESFKAFEKMIDAESYAAAAQWANGTIKAGKKSK